MEALYKLAELMLYFTAFAFIGWVWEVAYNRLKHGRWANSGFLQGPWIPVYGFGGVAIISFIAPLGLDPFLTFVISAFLATVLEYITHWLLEKLFGLSLWDYTDMPFDIKGRICLPATLLFGMLALFAIYTVQPTVAWLIGVMPRLAVLWSSASLFVVITLDFISTLASTINLRLLLPSVDWSFDELSPRLEQILNDLKQQRKAFRRFSRRLQSHTARRIASAFPNIGRRQSTQKTRHD